MDKTCLNCKKAHWFLASKSESVDGVCWWLFDEKSPPWFKAIDFISLPIGGHINRIRRISKERPYINCPVHEEAHIIFGDIE